LVSFAIAEYVDFVVIAGDIFDGKWQDMGTGLFFAATMAKLSAANIPVFLLKGNHDAESMITQRLPLPPSVQFFSSRRVETFLLEDQYQTRLIRRVTEAPLGLSLPPRAVLAKSFEAPHADGAD